MRKIDALVGRHSDVALDHRILNCDRASHRLDDAAELDQSPVAGALEHAAVLAGDGGVDEFGAQRPQPRERAVLVRARHAAEADDVGGQDRGDFAGLGSSCPSHTMHNNTKADQSRVAAMGRDLPVAEHVVRCHERLLRGRAATRSRRARRKSSSHFRRTLLILVLRQPRLAQANKEAGPLGLEGRIVGPSIPALHFLHGEAGTGDLDSRHGVLRLSVMAGPGVCDGETEKQVG